MSHNWTTKKLEDIVERVCVGFVGSCNSAYVTKDIGVPMIRTTNITESGLSFENLKYVTSEFHVKNKKSQLKKGDLLIARHGDSGLPSVYMSNEEANCLNAVMVKPYSNEQFIDNFFLMYSFKNNYVRHQIKAAVGGSVQGVVNTKTIAQLNIPYPDRDTRIKIVNILSSLDDKIELNRKMNQTLEAMAQVLFKSWFVNFDPVHAKAGCKSDNELEAAARELGISKEVLELFPSEFVESEMGMIPKGWEVSTIEEEVSIYGGATPSTKEDKYWIDGENHWATPRDLSGLNSKVLIDTGRKITNDGVNKISSKQLPVGTVLLSSRAPVGYIAYSTVPISINQGFIAMVCTKRLSNYYIMYWLDIAMNEIKSRAIGTTFAEISKSAFRPIKLVVAASEVLTDFDDVVAPMIKKIIANEYEIKTLEKTRDTLLPKLLSGELDVSEVKVST